jgi:hypothetical protein
MQGRAKRSIRALTASSGFHVCMRQPLDQHRRILNRPSQEKIKSCKLLRSIEGVNIDRLVSRRATEIPFFRWKPLEKIGNTC